MKLGLAFSQDLMTPDNFRFARQAGCTHVFAALQKYSVRTFPPATPGGAEQRIAFCEPDEAAWTYDGLRAMRAAINAEDLECEAIQGFDVAHFHDVMLDGPRKAEQMEKLKRIISDMGRVGIPIMGYSFTLAGVWGRGSVGAARGGAPSPGFHDPPETPIPDGMVHGRVYDTDLYDEENPTGAVGQISYEEFWGRLSEFLDEMLPVAEEAGVKMALHPEDPPMPTLRGTPRLVHGPDHFQQLLDLNPSESNTMLFCVGTLAEMADGDIYEMVDRYSRTGRIGFVHLRNVRGRVPHYDEVFIDEGDVDMIRVLRILKQNGFDGIITPDHTPQMSCGGWHAGKAHALGWIRAALMAIEGEG